MNFEREFHKAVEKYGGMINAHTHLDRAYVMKPEFVEYADMDPWEIVTYPLPVKQHTTGILHEGPAYKHKSLKERMERAIKESIQFGVNRIDSFIDTTADCIGLTALEVAVELKQKYKGSIDFRIGAYPIFGFKDSEKKRWDTFEAGAKMADYIGTLPERDAIHGHIGFNEHFRRVIELAGRLGKDIHMQVDQTNSPEDNGTETLIEAIRWLLPDKRGHACKNRYS